MYPLYQCPVWLKPLHLFSTPAPHIENHFFVNEMAFPVIFNNVVTYHNRLLIRKPQLYQK